MKTKIFSFVAALALALGFTGCSDDDWNPQLETEGTLVLSSMGVDVSTKENLLSRADGTIDISNFIVTIKSGEETKMQWKYSEMPEIITLAVGEYSVEVKSHNIQAQEWNKPYFFGTQKFTIEKNKITEIETVKCEFASLKVTIAFTDDILRHLSDDYKITVIAGAEGNLEFNKNNKDDAAYFDVPNGSTTLVATFEGTVDNQPISLSKQYDNIEKGVHLRLNYDIKSGDIEFPEESGNVTTAGITVNTTVNNVNTGANVNVEDETITPGERPGTEEPEQGEDPGENTGDEPSTPGENDAIAFESALSFDNENSVNVEEAIVVIKADAGFAHLNVTISSDNGDFLASAGELMPMSFDLATITGDDAENLESVGLPVGPYPATQKQIDFNITDLVPLLGAFPGHHAFALEVVDNDGNTKSITLKFYAE